YFPTRRSSDLVLRQVSIHAKKCQLVSCVVERCNDVQVRNIRYARQSRGPLLYAVFFHFSSRLHRLAGPFVRIHSEYPIRWRAEHPPALLPDPAKLHDARHIRDRHDIRHAHQHVQKPARANGSAHIVVSRRVALARPEQPLGKRRLHRVACLRIFLDLLVHLAQLALQTYRERETRLRDEIGRSVFSRHSVGGDQDRKSTRLNSSHRTISYAVFCLKKKKKKKKIKHYNH